MVRMSCYFLIYRDRQMQRCQNDETEGVIWKMWGEYLYAYFKPVILCRAILHLSEMVCDQNSLKYLMGRKIHAKPLQQMFLNTKVREEQNCFQDYIIRKDSQSEWNINKNKRVLRTQAENCLLAIILFIFVMCLSLDTFIPKGYSIFMVKISYKEYGILFQWRLQKHTQKILKIIFWCSKHWIFTFLNISANQWLNSRQTKIQTFERIVQLVT